MEIRENFENLKNVQILNKINPQKQKAYLLRLMSANHSLIELKSLLSDVEHNLDKIGNSYYLLVLNIENIFILEILAMRSFYLLGIEEIISEKEYDGSEKCGCLNNKINYPKSNNSSSFLENTAKEKIKFLESEYLENRKKSPFFPKIEKYKNTRILESFLKNNQFILIPEILNINNRDEFLRLYSENYPQNCVNSIEMNICGKNQTPEMKYKNIEAFRHLLVHRTNLTSPSIIYNYISSLSLLTKTVYKTNRKFFLKNDLKNLKFIGKTSMNLCNSVLIMNLLNLLPSEILFDPCCGSGTILYCASLFGAYVIGSDYCNKQLIGFNNNENRKTVKTSLIGFNIYSNFEESNKKNCLGFFRADFFKDYIHNFGNIEIDTIIIDFPYGYRSGMADTTEMYLKRLKEVVTLFKVRKIGLWVEDRIFQKDLFSEFEIIYKERQILKSCSRDFIVLSKL